MIYRIMPASYKRKIKAMLRDSGSRRDPSGFTNPVFLLSLAVAIVGGYFSGELFPYVAAGLFTGLFVFFHGALSLAADRRAGFVEKLLPDALQLMAANSRAGYIPSRALLMSARPEFGPLSEAIKKAGKEMTTGMSLEDSLATIPKHIRSEILGKTIRLIIEGIKSGGRFAELLEENAEDIRRVQGLKKEVRASVTMYIIFITFAGSVGAPILYSLAGFLIKTIGKLGQAAGTAGEGMQSTASFIQFTGIEISPDFLFYFSITAMVLTTFFGGLLVGSIASGKEKAGVKFIPILMITALAIFFLTGSFIEAMFGALLPK